MSKKVVIVGAGLGGISTAGYLAKAGYDVHVYEKLDYAGGRAGVLKQNGFYFDIGPSWYLMPEVFEHYFNLMGTTADEQLDLVKLKPSFKVFFDDSEPVFISPDQKMNRETFEAIESGAGNKLTKYAAKSQKIYNLALKHFLYTNFESLKDFLKPEIIANTPSLLRLTATTYDNEVSRYFKDSRLKRILEYSAVFLGASPFEAPGIYTLMSAIDYNQGVFYPKGGISTLPKKMYELSVKAGVKFHFGEPVSKINCKENIATGITLKSGKIIKADIVISDADLHFTETKLLDKQNQSYPTKYWQKRNPGPSALMIYLGVKGKLPELEHHDLILTEKWQENFAAIYKERQAPNPASIYISRTTATDPSHAPAGHEALVILVPFPSGMNLSDADYESLADGYIDDVARIAKIDNLKDRIVFRQHMTPNDFGSRYNSWQLNALGPAHTLKQTGIFRTNNRSKKVNNLYYVGGATIPGIGMPMVVIGAELLYKRIAGQKSGGQINKIEKLV